MGYLALYRKYRPDNFNDIVGQKYIIKTLKNEVANNKISHAYLFFGPRGTGKTTMAKAIAKLINCNSLDNLNPCEKCESCLLFNQKSNPDIIEIDAASNNGVEEIRTIRDNVALMPSVSNYKVYIIDEVHMLSSGAFNALLKTLEEPPKHVVFILATTEFYKVPETIVSRCQTFEFERISENEIVDKLNFIANAENIKVEEDVLRLIAKYSNGGLRDSISMLDKLAAVSSDIKVSDYYELCGIASNFQIVDLLKSIYSSDVNEVFKLLESLNKEGKSLYLVIDKLIDYFKDCIINNFDSLNENMDLNIYYKCLDILLETQLNSKSLENPNVVIQVGILKVINLFKGKQNDKIISREIILEKKCVENTKNGTKFLKSDDKLENFGKTGNIGKIDYDKVIVNNALATANKNFLEAIKEKWILFSKYLNDEEYSSVVSYLLDAQVRVVGESDVIISVNYDSILINVNKCLSKITELFNKVMDNVYNLVFVTDSEWGVIKDKYMSDRKKGIVYMVKTSSEDNNNDLVDETTHSKILDDAVNLFGNDMIEYK